MFESRPRYLTEPHPSTCNRCGEDVLLARDKDLLSYCLDPMPILPLGECGECEGRGTVCPVCKGTGQNGEELSPDHVLLSATRGIVRLNTGRPWRWDALHQRHRCTELPVRSEPRYAEARRVSRPTASET